MSEPVPTATAVLGAAAHPGTAPAAPPSDQAVFVGIALIVAVGAIKIVLRRRLSMRHAVSLDLIIVVIGFVLLLMMRLPIGRHPGWAGTVFFISLAAMYKLLGSFEEPTDKD